MPAAPQNTDAHRERVFYRDRDEFNAALDKAVDATQAAGRPYIVGWTIWWVLVGTQVLLYAAYWVFDWDVRRTLIPGIDLVKPLWIGIVAMAVYAHVWTRNRHARILTQRVCFKCGRRLLDVEVDDDDDGTCPGCDRRFNLGEYRRPSENRGRLFNGYIDGEHFESTVKAASEGIWQSRGSDIEFKLLGWSWLLLGLGVGVSWLTGWNLLAWLPWGLPYPVFLLGVMLLWSTSYYVRVQRIGAVVVDRRLCFNCGYCLLHTPTGDDGLGRCPECGGEFATAQYDRPDIGAPAD